MQLRTNFQNACRMVFRRPVSYSEKVPSEKPPKTFFDLTVAGLHSLLSHCTVCIVHAGGD